MSWYDTLLFWCCLFVIDNADYSVIRYDTLLLTYTGSASGTAGFFLSSETVIKHDFFAVIKRKSCRNLIVNYFYNIMIYNDLIILFFAWFSLSLNCNKPYI